MVGHILAKCQLAVGEEARQHLDLIEEVAHHVGAFLEVLGIVGGPPLAQIAVLVELGALVVESVGHLMTDDHSDGTIVEGVVGLHIEERRLQNTCGEADLVGGRVVVGVHRLGSHIPDRIVHGLVQLLIDHIVDAPDGGSLDVLPVVAADLEVRVVAPLVGISDLDDEGIELLMCHCLRGVRHPLLSIDALSEGHLQVAHQLRHAFLGGSGEVLLDIQLTYSLAECSFCGTDGTLPARTVFLLARHDCSEEGKVLGTHLIVEEAGGGIDELPADIILQDGQIGLCPQFLHGLDEFGLTYADFLHSLGAMDTEVEAPVDAWEGDFQGIVGHLMIVLFVVAEFCAAAGGLGELCLEGKDGVHASGNCCLVVLQFAVFEQTCHILLISLTDRGRGGVGVEVVVFLPHDQSRLPDLHQVHGAVLDVGIDIEAEESVDALSLQAGVQAEQLFLVEAFLNALQILADWFCVLCIEAYRVHSAVVHLCNLVCYAARFVLLGCSILYELAQLDSVVFCQLVETAESGIFCGEGMTVGPAASGETIEVCARSSCGVEIGEVDACGECGLSSSASSEEGECHKWKNVFDFHIIIVLTI